MPHFWRGKFRGAASRAGVVSSGDVIAGWKGRISEIPASELDEADRMAYDFSHHLVYDTARIRTELGYAEVILPQAALARILEYERATKY